MDIDESGEVSGIKEVNQRHKHTHTHIYTTNRMEEIETAAPPGIRLGGANFFTSLYSFHVNQHVAQLLDCCLVAMTLIHLMRIYDDKFFSWSFQL